MGFLTVSTSVRLRLRAFLLGLILIVIPTRSLSAPSDKVLELSHQETTELGQYIRQCEVDKRVLTATDKLLTDCEFRNRCRMSWKPFLMGLALGAAAIYAVESQR